MMRKSLLTGLIGLCMAVFGILGIYVVAEQSSIRMSGVLPSMRFLTFGLLGFVVVMGVWNLAVAVMKRNDDHAPVPGFLLAYRDAWRGFRSRKWLLVLTCYLALINILGTLIESAIFRYNVDGRVAPIFKSHGLSDMLSEFHGFPPLIILFESLSSSIRGAIDHFLPGMGVKADSVAFVLLALSVLCLLPWINRKLASYQDQSPLASAAGFFRRLIVPIGISALLVIVVQVYSVWFIFNYAASLNSQSQSASEMFIRPWLGIAAYLATEIFYTAIVMPLFVGGMAGSLQRASSGDQVTAVSFLEDSIRTYRPIAGIFVLFGLIRMFTGAPGITAFIPVSTGLNSFFSQINLLLYPVWPLLMVVVMFAPYAVFAGAGSMWKGLRESIGIWRNCGYNLLSFTAFGIALLAAILVAANLIGGFAGAAAISPSPSIPSLIMIVIRTGARIFMAVAVWDIYQQIRAASVEEHFLGTDSESGTTEPVV